MDIFKRVMYWILAVFAVGILCFSCYFLFRAIPRPNDQPPEILNTEDIFAEEEPFVAEEPVEEALIEEEPPAEEEAPVDENSPRARAEVYLQTMTAEEKIWQLFITTPEDITGVETATRAGDTTKEAVETCPVGGLCYFADNLEDQAQAVEMLSKTQSYAKTPMFLCVDEEGGRVSRAGSNENIQVTHFPAAAEYGKTGNVTEVYDMAKTLAKELKALGFNLNFAPVADLASGSTEIGDRAYSDDPKVAGSLAAAMVDGLQKEQMLSCLKHFPGHGDASGDSHEEAVYSTRTLEELQQAEWVSFEAGIDAGVMLVMVSHVINENLSPLPADLSPEVIGYLRQELGFAGIIITDSHQMKSITDHYSSGEAAVLALQAGVDMILMPQNVQEAVSAVQTAVDDGKLTWERLEESLLRILTIKYAFGIM